MSVLRHSRRRRRHSVAFEIELFIRRSRAILERAIVKSESRLMDLKVLIR